jgi:hypothetical protein
VISVRCARGIVGEARGGASDPTPRAPSSRVIISCEGRIARDRRRHTAHVFGMRRAPQIGALRGYLAETSRCNHIGVVALRARRGSCRRKAAVDELIVGVQDAEPHPRLGPESQREAGSKSDARPDRADHLGPSPRGSRPSWRSPCGRARCRLAECKRGSAAAQTPSRGATWGSQPATRSRRVHL